MGKKASFLTNGLNVIRFITFCFCAVLILVFGCKEKTTEPEPDFFQLLKVSANQKTLSSSSLNEEVSTELVFTIEFSNPVDTSAVREGIQILEENEQEILFSIEYENENKNILLTPTENLEYKTLYTLKITDHIKSALGAEFPGVEFNVLTKNGEFELISGSINETAFPTSSTIRKVAYDDISVSFTFSEPLNLQDYENYFTFSPALGKAISLSGDGKTVTIINTDPLDYYRFYSVFVSSNLTANNGFEFSGFDVAFQTGLDPSIKFPLITDDELLTKVQEQTFKYFWDFAHPVSGMARERNTSGETVTIGGSGFGIMSILVGIERGFISKSGGIERLQKIVEFLGDADRFHGAWPHWMNGSTGAVIPFSTNDDGADLVETAFMAQGLITVRQYLDENIPNESNLIEDINFLLDGIEWDWFTRNDQNVLYWHWSPNVEWAMNHQIKGYNEALIVYILAASSKNYAINADVYHQGWASSGNIQNGNMFYGYTLPVGYNFGGPLFFAHYSFLGLDPRGLSDLYADYWLQNRNHTLINRAHSVENPNNFVGYSSDSWGLTASDENGGYGVHEPTRDDGTITPTAALSSMPYTPDESMEALRHFYYVLGDKLWGEYGFYDAFNPTESWWANSYLAIDQGPIIIMVENHRTGLLWDLFMSAPEVQTALNNLGFTISE